MGRRKIACPLHSPALLSDANEIFKIMEDNLGWKTERGRQEKIPSIPNKSLPFFVFVIVSPSFSHISQTCRLSCLRTHTCCGLCGSWRGCSNAYLLYLECVRQNNNNLANYVMLLSRKKRCVCKTVTLLLLCVFSHLFPLASSSTHSGHDFVDYLALQSPEEQQRQQLELEQASCAKLPHHIYSWRKEPHVISSPEITYFS